MDLPWAESSDDKLVISEARAQLDADHYGMEKVKKRVIEFLAVKQLKNCLLEHIVLARLALINRSLGLWDANFIASH